MDALWNFVRDELWPHWPGVVGFFGLVLIGQFMKVQVWSKKRAQKSKLFLFMRRTLSMHAPVCGLLVGMAPGMPVSPGIEGTTAAMLYWFGVGVAASFGFHIVKQYIKTKYKVDLGEALDNAVNPSMEPSEPPPSSDKSE